MLPWAGSAQDWKERVEVFDSIQSMEAPDGYQVLSSPGGQVIKKVDKPEKVNTKAAVEFEGKRYYMSDWSWTRYQQGKEPYWILMPGSETPAAPPERAAPEPVSTPAPPALPPAIASGGASPAGAVAEPPPVAEPVAAIGATAAHAPDREEGAEDGREAADGTPEPPTDKADPADAAARRLEEKWDGMLEVYPACRDIPAPKGFKLIASPERNRKALKSTGSKTSITVQAALTRSDGYVYYISDWSWSRAKAGNEPSWMFVTGSTPVKPPPGKAGDGATAPVRPSAAPAPKPPRAAVAVADAAKPAARPKLTLDGVEASGRVVALLVGIGRYSSANRTQRMLDLDDPGPDLELVGRTLRTLNVEVHEEKDLNREQFARVVQDTAAGLHAGDVFLFYYSGHAVQVSGKNYLVPLGINFLDRKTVRETAFPLDELWAALTPRSLRFAAVCLDGCRKNPFNSKDSTFYILSRIPGLNLSPDAGNRPGLAAEKPPRNMLLSFSAEPGRVMAEAGSGAQPTRYAAALAAALAENVEIREAVALVNRRVSEWTGRQQSPWSSAGDFPQFYLHTPGRSTLDPDRAVQQAGEWLMRERDKGLPFAVGLLARSVRERPAGNPATAGLLFLLGYQAMPIPLRSWGPLPAEAGGYAGELQLSLDGRHLALFAAGGDKPGLILDRDTGEVVTDANASFSPGYGKLAIAAERLGQERAAGAEELGVITFRRKAVGGEPEQSTEAVHAMMPLVPRARLIAWYHDEGLERIFLALQDGEQRVTFHEFATTPPVGCREDLRVAYSMPDLEKTGSVPLAAGSLPAGPDGPARVWSLVYDRPSDEVRFLLGAEQVYRRPGATKPGRRLDDFRLDTPARKLVLVYRDHVDVLGLNGTPASAFDLPPAPGSARRVLAFNAAFRRLALAWGPASKPGEEGGHQIAMFDVSTGQRIGGLERMAGYAEFAALSADEEWFLYYDSSRRIRLADMVSGGARLHLPGTATLQPLPVGAGLEPPSSGEFPSYELRCPPLLDGLGGPAVAAPWLADLAEALIGFRVNENSEVEWLDNPAKRLQSAAHLMRKRPGDEVQKAWAKWLLVNRLDQEE